MAGRSGAVRFAVMAICLGATALGLANTYGDNAEVVAMAERAACGTGDCAFEKLREERSPFGQSFTFQVKVTEKGKAKAATTDVKCAREYVLVGAYSCERVSGGLPGH